MFSVIAINMAKLNLKSYIVKSIAFKREGFRCCCLFFFHIKKQCYPFENINAADYNPLTLNTILCMKLKQY